MIRVLSVFGTRPEAIKVTPVIRELRKHPEAECRVCVTAQHRRMLDQVLRLFEIEPDYDLNIMQDDQSLSYVTARVLTELDGVIQRERPDWVLVQGDTTTTMAATLAAFYQRVKVGHVEAGLRTWDRFRPYPEEINRKITDAACDLHFAPTETGKENLLREGVPEEGILVTGNTVIDALLGILNREFSFVGTPLEGIPFDNRRVILLTAHRRENFGGQLGILDEAFLTQQFPLDGGLRFWRDPFWARELIRDRESFRIVPVLLPKGKETSLADIQRLLHFFPAHQT